MIEHLILLILLCYLSFSPTQKRRPRLSLWQRCKPLSGHTMPVFVRATHATWRETMLAEQHAKADSYLAKPFDPEKHKRNIIQQKRKVSVVNRQESPNFEQKIIQILSRCTSIKEVVACLPAAEIVDLSMMAYQSLDEQLKAEPEIIELMVTLHSVRDYFLPDLVHAVLHLKADDDKKLKLLELISEHVTGKKKRRAILAVFLDPRKALMIQNENLNLSSIQFAKLLITLHQVCRIEQSIEAEDDEGNFIQKKGFVSLIK